MEKLLPEEWIENTNIFFSLIDCGNKYLPLAIHPILAEDPESTGIMSHTWWSGVIKMTTSWFEN